MTTFMLEEYMADLRIQWLSLDSQDYYLSYIRRFIQTSGFTDVSCFWNFIKLKMAYYALFDDKRSNNTIYKYYKTIKKYSQFLLDNNIIDKCYISQIKRVKTTVPLPKAMSQEDVEKMLAHLLKTNKSSSFLKMRNYVLISTMLFSGLRRMELSTLKKANVFDKHLLIEQWKWRKDRIVYIPAELSRQLQWWLEIQTLNEELLFCGSSGEPMSRNAISCIFHRLEKTLGFSIHPHLLRHTYASMCIKRGINLHTLQQQMWHSNISTTSVYLYLNSTENYNEMQKLRL